LSDLTNSQELGPTWSESQIRQGIVEVHEGMDEGVHNDEAISNSILSVNSIPSETQNSHVVEPVQEWNWTSWMFQNQEQSINEFQILGESKNIGPDNMWKTLIWLHNSSTFTNQFTHIIIVFLEHVIVWNGSTDQHCQTQSTQKYVPQEHDGLHETSLESVLWKELWKNEDNSSIDDNS